MLSFIISLILPASTSLLSRSLLGDLPVKASTSPIANSEAIFQLATWLAAVSAIVIKAKSGSPAVIPISPTSTSPIAVIPARVLPAVKGTVDPSVLIFLCIIAVVGGATTLTAGYGSDEGSDESEGDDGDYNESYTDTTAPVNFGDDWSSGDDDDDDDDDPPPPPSSSAADFEDDFPSGYCFWSLILWLIILMAPLALGLKKLVNKIKLSFDAFFIQVVDTVVLDIQQGVSVTDLVVWTGGVVVVPDLPILVPRQAYRAGDIMDLVFLVFLALLFFHAVYLYRLEILEYGWENLRDYVLELFVRFDVFQPERIAPLDPIRRPGRVLFDEKVKTREFFFDEPPCDISDPIHGTLDRWDGLPWGIRLEEWWEEERINGTEFDEYPLDYDYERERLFFFLKD